MRRRMLNPDFFTDPDIVANLNAYGRLFYQGLWCVAEDSGCFEMNALLLKMKIFPGDNLSLDDIKNYLDKLVELGKIITYSVSGKEYGWIKNFFKHQRLDKPSPPSIPLPEWIIWHGEKEFDKRHQWHYELYEDALNTIQELSTTCPRQDQDTTTPEEKRSKEKRSEKKGSKVCPNSPSPDLPFTPDEDDDPEIEYPVDSMPYKAACYLRDKIIEINSRVNVPPDDPYNNRMQSWAVEMERLNRIGPPGSKKGKGYSWEEIYSLIEFCYQDEFWRANILSAAKFREQIVKLENKAKAQNARGHPKGRAPGRNVENALKLVSKYENQDAGGETIW